MNKLKVILQMALILITGIATYSTYLLARQGKFEKAFTPSWTDFAIAHPMIFAFLLVFGALALGGPFIRFMDNL